MKNKMEERGKTTKTIKMISLSLVVKKKNNPKEEKTLVL
jgi:hypothetical protein